ncbi:DUF7112 family protein [Halospeciosus flavus]|uniref:Uncharacterized protein n=2 Tax=Halospeciosus flavus TaxID=3032283 RepID=A0ABD5Z4D9_9EURY|nr:hypothetical protein [Halospeciosus flavus]
MADRVTHETCTTYDATLERAGGTRRPQVVLPADAADEFPDGEVVRLVLDGSEYRAQVRSDSAGRPVIRGAYDTPDLARDPSGGENRLREWVDEKGLDVGRSVHVDVVESGFKYGLRAPGEESTYAATGKPKDTLADIAKNLDR